MKLKRKITSVFVGLIFVLCAIVDVSYTFLLIEDGEREEDLVFASQYLLPEVAESVAGSTVDFYSKNRKQGSAFFDPNKKILITNYHVGKHSCFGKACENSLVEMVGRGGGYDVTKIDFQSRKCSIWLDVCLFLAGPFDGNLVGRDPEIGDEFFVLPFRSEQQGMFRVRLGKVIGSKPTQFDAKLYSVGGYSGSPLFGKDGLLLGVAVRARSRFLIKPSGLFDLLGVRISPAKFVSRTSFIPFSAIKKTVGCFGNEVSCIGEELQLSSDYFQSHLLGIDIRFESTIRVILALQYFWLEFRHRLLSVEVRNSDWDFLYQLQDRADSLDYRFRPENLSTVDERKLWQKNYWMLIAARLLESGTMVDFDNAQKSLTTDSSDLGPKFIDELSHFMNILEIWPKH